MKTYWHALTLSHLHALTCTKMCRHSHAQTLYKIALARMRNPKHSNELDTNNALRNKQCMHTQILELAKHSHTTFLKCTWMNLHVRHMNCYVSHVNKTNHVEHAMHHNPHTHVDTWSQLCRSTAHCEFQWTLHSSAKHCRAEQGCLAPEQNKAAHCRTINTFSTHQVRDWNSLLEVRPRSMQATSDPPNQFACFTIQQPWAEHTWKQHNQFCCEALSLSVKLVLLGLGRCHAWVLAWVHPLEWVATKLDVNGKSNTVAIHGVFSVEWGTGIPASADHCPHLDLPAACVQNSHHHAETFASANLLKDVHSKLLCPASISSPFRWCPANCAARVQKAATKTSSELAECQPQTRSTQKASWRQPNQRSNKNSERTAHTTNMLSLRLTNQFACTNRNNHHTIRTP